MNPILIFIITSVSVLGVLGAGATGTCVATLVFNGSEAVLAIGALATIGGAIAVAIKLPPRLRGKTPPLGPA